MSELTVQSLLDTPSMEIRDVLCAGRCRHRSPEEAATGLHVVFPYRGVYVRHLGRDDAVADANQVLFFNHDDGYRVSHPRAGGDASLDLVLSESLVRELVPRAMLRGRSGVAFRRQRHRLDAHAQALVALLRHRLRYGHIEPLEAEALALTLVQRALGPRTTHVPGGSIGRQRLVDRTKLALASDAARRWTLAEVADVVGHSPVYLTQAFREVEGLPLYRYQQRLRLARALDLLAEYDDLTVLALDLGFSSHSHFSTAFRKTYGCSPSAFRSAGRRSSADRLPIDPHM